MDAFVQVARARDMHRVEQLLTKAVTHGYAPAGLDPDRFLAGLAIISRPLPDVTAQLLPDQREWIVNVYIAGLRAAAQSDEK